MKKVNVNEVKYFQDVKLLFYVYKKKCINFDICIMTMH